jgi:hypothetical protein
VNESAIDGTNDGINAPDWHPTNDSKCCTETWCTALECDHQAALVGLLLNRTRETHGLRRVGPSI